MRREITRRTQWFRDARFGTFIHFGPYAQYGRGEQVLFREFLDQNKYAQRAMAWQAHEFDAGEWARVFKNSGSRYTVMTTRHHDGFCLWDTKTTNYSSIYGAAKCDFISKYVKAMREEGLKVGLYYSLADWRIPAYFAGPSDDPGGFNDFVSYIHEQVRELMSNYGKIDILWFDGAWPHYAEDWQAKGMVNMIRKLQPDILINPRLGPIRGIGIKDEKYVNVFENNSDELSDFATSEKSISPSVRIWEAQDVSTWRCWGWSVGEYWKSSEEIIDRLAQTVSLNGNYLLNVGPKPDGSLPSEYKTLMDEIGRWMKINGEAIYGTEGGNVVEFSTRGWQILKGNVLYLVICFWDGAPSMELSGIKTPVKSAQLLGTDVTLKVEQKDLRIKISGLPKEKPVKFHPVIRLEFEKKPQAYGIFKYRLWKGTAKRMVPWAASRCHGEKITDYTNKS
ncbi:MAG: alpha-L-fucosidase [bacterium]